MGSREHSLHWLPSTLDGLELPPLEVPLPRDAAQSPGLADHLHVELGRRRTPYTNECADAVIESQVTIALQIVVGSRPLVASHFTEHPLDAAAGLVKDQIDDVHARFGDASAQERIHLERAPDRAVVCHLAHTVPENVPAAGASPRDDQPPGCPRAHPPP